MINSYVHSEYLSEVFNQSIFPQIIRKVRMKLRNTKYDTIVFRGISGAAVSFPLAFLTGKGLLCVRKRGVSHSSLYVEGVLSKGRYVIIDDFIETGKTLRKIKREVENVHLLNGVKIPKCVAIVFYNHGNPKYVKEVTQKVYPKVKVHVIDREDYIY